MINLIFHTVAIVITKLHDEFHSSKSINPKLQPQLNSKFNINQLINTIDFQLYNLYYVIYYVKNRSNTFSYMLLRISSNFGCKNSCIHRDRVHTWNSLLKPCQPANN